MVYWKMKVDLDKQIANDLRQYDTLENIVLSPNLDYSYELGIRTELYKQIFNQVDNPQVSLINRDITKQIKLLEIQRLRYDRPNILMMMDGDIRGKGKMELGDLAE